MGGRYRFTVDFSAVHEGVSGSCILTSVHHPKGEIKFVVDCGIFQGEENSDAKNKEMFPFKPKNIDFMLLTHNHADHNGKIPVLYKYGFYGKIYTTKDTSIMLPYAMEDNEKIIRLSAQRNSQKAIYDHGDVVNALTKVEAHPFEETFSPMDDVKVTFFKNGHLIGAAMILVQISCEGYDDINILFTGDYKRNNFFFNVPKLPKKVRNLPLYIVCESTYGTTLSSQTNQPVFISNVAEMLNSGKNIVLIMALSLGRYQEIEYRLKMAQGKEFDANIPIWFDGDLAITYNHLFRDKLDIREDMKDFMPMNSAYVEKCNRERIISNTSTKQIIVTTAGMGTFGPAQWYIPRLIERHDVGMHFTSYLAKGTTGEKLINAQKSAFVGSVLKYKNADVRTTSEFSSHAKADELAEFLSTFSDIRGLMINHGEPETKERFAEFCKHSLLNCKDVAVLGMGYTIRVNEWKIVKSIREK